MADQWNRSGNLLYTLERVGWRKGDPVEQNRLMVRIDGGPNATKEEVDDLTARLERFLSEGC